MSTLLVFLEGLFFVFLASGLIERFGVSHKVCHPLIIYNPTTRSSFVFVFLFHMDMEQNDIGRLAF